ncbi:MAG: hypothetical protein QRY72_05495 [Candidatus Rhabdochlamydia sp.]
MRLRRTFKMPSGVINNGPPYTYAPRRAHLLSEPADSNFNAHG